MPKRVTSLRCTAEVCRSRSSRTRSGYFWLEQEQEWFLEIMFLRC